MNTIKYYILTIDVNQSYDLATLKKQLDLCLDWLRIVPGVYLLRSNSTIGTLYERFSTSLNDTRFFITEVNLTASNYVGRLQTGKWDWIKERIQKDTK